MISVRSKEKIFSSRSAWVRRILYLTLAEENEKGDLNVLFIGDEEMANLNKTYRKKTGPTDVLAFSGHTGKPLDPKIHFLGDLAISIPTAMRQAVSQGHSLENEVAFLLIHGVLHLCGYEHGTPAGRRKMFARQEKIFIQAKRLSA